MSTKTTKDESNATVGPEASEPRVGSTEDRPATPRGVELAFVQLCSPAFPHLSAYRGEAMIVADERTKLTLTRGGHIGMPEVVIENEDFTVPAIIPITNVAGYGLKR